MLVQLAMMAASAVPPPPSPSPSPPVYTLMNEALSWSDANAACRAAGLQLASVQTAAENALLLTAAAGNAVWIGGTDAASEGTWVWSPSSTPLSYTNWHPGQPSNSGGNQNCLSFNWGSPAGKWDDDQCWPKRKYVCQTPPPFLPPSDPRPSMDITIYRYIPASILCQQPIHVYMLHQGVGVTAWTARPK